MSGDNPNAGSGNNNSNANNIQDAARRFTLGMSNRRSSLGMAEAALGDLFGRRASGFSDLDVLGRRGSMDSTSAVLDAAIMDLTRRRLSMAMGVGDGFGGGDPFGAGGGFPGMDAMAGGAYGGMGMGMGMASFGAAGQMSMNMNAMNNANKDSSSGDNNNSNNDDGPMDNQQKQILEQQRELERRQKELEIQRQQLMAAMEERRVVMQQMQQKLGQMPSASMQRNSLLGSFGGGLGMGNLGGNSNLLMGLGGAMGGLASGFGQGGVPTSNGVAPPGWQVCKICNSRAFSNRDECAQHEALCIMDRGRRASLGMNNPAARRSSLDMLVGLAGQSGRRDSLGMGIMSDRRFSLLGDVSSNNNDMSNLMQQNNLLQQGMADQMKSIPPTTYSTGPFAMMDEPLPLSMDSDKDWLTPLHCFVRQHCVHVFTASEQDVATPSKGKRKPINVGQVGIRCPHCHHDIESSVKARERGSVYYPTSIASIYNATMNLLQRHLHNCTSVPPDIMRRYETLKADDARSGTSKKYWIESALSLGLVDTDNGIRFSGRPGPPPPSRPPGNDIFSDTMVGMNGDAAGIPNLNMDNSDGSGDEKDDHKASPEGDFDEQALSAPGPSGGPLVRPEDEPYATGFSFHLLRQMQPCVFTEADRLGKRKGLPPGFPGLACRHCFGGYGSGRFFPSSIKTLSDTSKTLNVLHNHMMRCRKCPPEIRELLAKLRKHHDEQRAKMKFGSQKAFFARIWDRLHYKDPNVTPKRKFKGKEQQQKLPPNLQAAIQQQQQQQQASFDTAMAMQQFGVDMINKRQKLS